ncbi:MAG: hypothetical protein COB36_03445 [Alphaproteobacteria bacterium]|nr:MAG: hypothetical protein COB36_03445 [Alphaproteobacteria bacterium]
MTKNNIRLNVFFLLLTLFSAILVLSPLINYPIIISELLISFRVIVSLAFLCVLVILIVARAYVFGVVQALLLIGNMWPVISAYTFDVVAPRCAYDGRENPLKVLSFNVYFKNDNYESIYQILKTSEADIIVLQEAQLGFMRYGHGRLKVDYPFYYPAIEGDRYGRWTLYSRYPVIETRALNVAGARSVALYAKIDVNGRIVNVITLHAKSPKTLNRIEIRNARLDGLGSVVRGIMRDNQYVIVAGDFNNVPWHPTMTTFKERTGLRNNNVVYNYFGTWPAWFPSFFSIPIDHIFYDQSFHHVLYSRKPSVGSDHYPFSADLYFCDNLENNQN